MKKTYIILTCFLSVFFLISCTVQYVDEIFLDLKKEQFYGDWYFKDHQRSKWHYYFANDRLCYRYEKAGLMDVEYKYTLWYVTKSDSIRLINNSKYQRQTFRIHSITEKQLVWSINNQKDTLIKRSSSSPNTPRGIDWKD